MKWHSIGFMKMNKEKTQFIVTIKNKHDKWIYDVTFRILF